MQRVAVRVSGRGAHKSVSAGTVRKPGRNGTTTSRKGNPLGESRVEKPRGDDSLRDRSTGDGATGHAAGGMKPVPANAARSVLKPNRYHAGFLLCGEAPP
ncbi:hypothetical protein ACFFQF_29675 [Haladaptatus pallidirubidus]|uniref:hypothetical protein n=1 Tax=Haladaptatus pallidirubidus TaxID=1008152 RepID=UPI001D118882|nr:hypothetical protein [Haladaptatus pallidirubidus]